MDSKLLAMKKKIELLKKEVHKHDELYYIKSMPVINDDDYDKLKKTLEDMQITYFKLYNNDNVIDNVAEHINIKLQEDFIKVKHTYPMLSLSNASNKNDINSFFLKIKKLLIKLSYDEIQFQCEPKVDGVSFAAYFNFGKLEYAATRGDGIVGENITNNIKMIATFPTTVNFLESFEVRGEVYMTKENFLSLNKKDHKNKNVFCNARNAASGSLRQIDPNVTKNRSLSYFVWGGRLPNVNTHKSMMDQFKRLGFIINKNTLLTNSFDKIMNYYQTMAAKRASLNYDIDGLVYKVNNLDLQNKIGSTNRAPRWAIAHKFPSHSAETTVKNIFVQVGRTGAITPVAMLKPVNIGGVVVTRVSLHNEQEILKKDIRIGDTVLVKRSGDVIPHIVQVNLQSRSSTVQKFFFPANCPICQNKIDNPSKNGIKRCLGGLSCQAQVVQALCHFVSKSAFNITGLSKCIIMQFYVEQILTTPSDIFRLKDFNNQMRIEKLKGWGSKSVKNLYLSIEKAATVKLDRFVYALGIRYVGVVTARAIAEYFGNIDRLLSFISQSDKANHLKKINGIGTIIVKSVISFLDNSFNIKVIKDILRYVTVTPIIRIVVSDNKLNNKTVVFSGKFEKYSRSNMEHIAFQMGAKVVKSLSKKTTYLIHGKDVGSKIDKAKNLKINILSEDCFLNMIDHIKTTSKITVSI